MKVLITGATGLIGSALVKYLLEKDHIVHYLTTSKDKIENKPNYQGFYWNMDEAKIDENCIYGVDVIIHLAGANIAKRWTNSYKQEIIESRTLSSELLFNLLRKIPNQVKQIVSASGTDIYPDSFSKVFDETTIETGNGFLSSVVQKWEEGIDKFKILGIKVCKLRTGMVLSNHGGALPQMVKPVKFGLGAAFSSGKQIQSWIHIEDLVAMYFFVINNQLEGVFNAVAPTQVTNEELTKVIAKTLNKPVFLPNIPKFVLELMLGEMASLLFSSKNISARKILDSGFQFQFPEINKAITNLYV